MRRRLISFFIGVFVLSGACLLGQENKTRTSQIITISDYGVFLEAMASASQKGLLLSLPIEVVAINDFGDQKLVNALGASGVLMRSGKPGSYCYQVVTSESDAPVPFLSWDDAVCYGAWKKTLQEKEGEEGESWGVEVKHGSAEMDHALRSNLFLFQVVDNKTMAHEAVGEEVASGMLDQMLEAILGMGALASAVPRDESVPSRAGERPKDLRSLLSPAPVLDLTISEDVEQREMSKIFTQALTGKAPNYYAKSDAMVPELEQAWEVRAVARQHLQVKEEALEQAQAKFKEEEELLAGKNIEKTALGRIANAAGKASSIASPVSVPIVSLSGIFQGASTLADIANRRIEKHSFKQARTALEKATKEEREARQRFDQLEEAAFALDAARKKPEEEAYRVQQDDAFQVARRLKPPLESNKEEAWQQWAETLLGGTKASRQEIVAFAQKAKTHPNWAAQRAAQAWVERMNHEEQNFRELEEEHKRKLELLEVPYALAQEKAQEARDTATAAYKREEGMIQAESDTHEEYNTVRELLRQLEAQKQKTTMLQQSIEQVKNETRQAYDIWQRAKRELQGNTLANERLIKETEESALHLEAQALKLFQQKEALQKKGARGIERVKAQLVADQRAWRETWPEEVLHQKLQERSGEKLFAVALSSKSQAAWREAQEEAEELGALWQRMKNHPYQGLWKECAKRAALKKIFVEIQERWGAFSDAVQMLVENPNFDPDFKNSQNLAARGEEIVHAMEQALPLINEGLFPVIGTGVNSLARSVRNVVRIAKQKANSPKPLGESTWKDVVKEEAIFKSLEAAEVAPPLWQEEAAWIAQAIQEAGTFAKSIAAPSQDLNKSRYINSAELQELGKALVEETVSQMKKAMYQKQIRYMRARRNFVGRSLEPQKMALFERKKSFYKKERRWKGERGLLERRKKLAPQWKRESLQQEKLSFQGLQGVEKVEMKEADSNKPLEEEVTMDEAAIPLVEGAADPFEDIIDQESHLVEERVVLNQEKRAIDRQEEDLKERTFKLEEDAKVMDQRGALLTKEEAMLAKKKAELFSEQTGREEETSLELVQRRESLRIEEARILQEREALAKEAESLEALASAQLDQKTWESLFKKLHRLIEQEKETVLKARCAEGTDAFMSWLEAHHIAGRAQELWEEIIEDMTRQGEADENSVEKRNAQKEKEMWEYKRKEYLAKADGLKVKINQQHLEKEDGLKLKEKKFFEARQHLEGMERLAEQQEQIAMAQEEVTSSYLTIEEAKKNQNIIEIYTKNAAAYMEQEEALEDHAKALAAGDNKRAALYAEMAEAYGSAAMVCERAIQAYLRNDHKIVKVLKQQSDAYFEYAIGLMLQMEVKIKLQKKIIELLSNAADAYTRAMQGKEQANNKIAETFLKSAQIYTRQRALDTSLENIIAEIQEKAGTFYLRALLEDTEGNCQMAVAYYKSAQAYEQYSEALMMQGDVVYKSIISSAVAVAREGNREALEAYLQCAKACEERVRAALNEDQEAYEERLRASLGEDQKPIDLQEQIMAAYGSAAEIYEWIHDEGKVNRNEAVRAAYQSARAYEYQAEALRMKDKASAALQQKIAESCWKAANNWLGSSSCLHPEIFVSADKVIRTFCKNEETYDQKVAILANKLKVLRQTNQRKLEIETTIAGVEKSFVEDGTSFSKKIEGCYVLFQAKAKAYQQIAEAYEQQAKLFGNKDKMGVAMREKAIEAYGKSAEAYQQHIEFLAKRDEAEATLQEKIAKVQKNIAKICERLFNPKKEENSEYGQQLYKAIYKSLKSHEELLKALTQKDEASVPLQERILAARSESWRAYDSAVAMKVNGHYETAEAYYKEAQAHEGQAEALIRAIEALRKGDQAKAALQERIAKTLQGVVDAYETMGKAQADVNDEAVEATHKAIKAYEQEENALNKGDEATADLYHQCANAYRQQASALIQSTIALSRRDKIEAGLQEEIATAYWFAARAYIRVIKEKEKGNFQKGELFYKNAQAYQQQAEALIQSSKALILGNQTIAALQEKIAVVQGNAANAYRDAAEAETKNHHLLEHYCKIAEAYEKQAEALAKNDTETVKILSMVIQSYEQEAESLLRELK